MEVLTNLTLDEFRSTLKKCSGKRIALDTETDGLRWWANKLITVGFFCPDADVAGSIDIVDNPEMAEKVRAILRTTLASGTTTIFHNAKFDLSFMDANPLITGWRIVDTTYLIHMIDSRYPKKMEEAEKLLFGSNSKREAIDSTQFGPDPVIFQYSKKTGKQLKKSRKPKIWEWNADKRQVYCINDCRVTYQFAEVLYPFVAELGMGKLFAKEMKYLGLLYNIEHTGILTDPAFIGKASLALMSHLKELESQLYDACGKEFNWRSNQQLSSAIYEGLGISRPKNPFADADGVDKSRFSDKGKYNKYMTSSFILMEKAHHPLGELISSIREAYKLRKTLQEWLDLSDEEYFIHTNFNGTGTRTGRLSSSKPNLQNTPSDVRSRFTQGLFSGGTIRSEEYNLRNAFVAREGYLYLSIDYKQMEMRMFGIISGDKLLIAALASGTDIHLWIAIQVWGDCGEEENQIHREWSKTISFGLIYGMTTGSLQFKLGMSKSQAQKVTDDYWSRFPRIRPWLFEVIAECKSHHYVRYWSDRIWREEKEEDMYKAANALIQGGCADMLSIAVMRSWEWLQLQGGESYGRIVNLVHDEIIFEIPEQDINRAAKELSKIMQVPDLFNLPFLTDAKVGKSYGSLDKYKIL